MNKRSEKAIIAIYNGLFSLLDKENFEKVTVREICRESSVNKMTFYKYHKDKYDALAKGFLYIFGKDFEGEFGKESEYAKGVGDEKEIYRAIRFITSWCAKNKEKIHNIFATQDGLPYEIVKTAILNNYSSFVKRFIDTGEYGVSHEYVSTYVFSGYIGCIEVYLKKLRAGKDLEEVEREVDAACRLFAKGWAALIKEKPSSPLEQ